MALPRIERERLLGGNWNIRASAGTVFRRGWFQAIDSMDERLVESEVRAWDLAASEVTPQNQDPDWTVGVRVARLRDGRYVIRHVERIRATAANVERTIERIATSDGKRVAIRLPQDPGQAGKAQAQHLVRRLSEAGHVARSERITGSKVDYALPVSALAEQGLISIVRGPWLEPTLGELEGFPDASHDDIVDAVSMAFGALSRPVVRFRPTPIESVGYGID